MFRVFHDHRVNLLILMAAVTLSVYLSWTGFRLITDDFYYVSGAVQWMLDPPVLGYTHWELRHPYVVPMALSFHLFGISEFSATIPTIVAAYLAALLCYLTLIRLFPTGPALIASLLFCTLPVFGQTASTLTPDILEFFFGLGGIYGLVRAADSPRHWVRWCLFSGVFLFLGWMTRETITALYLAFAVLFVTGFFVPRKAILLIGALCGLLIAAEFGAYWVATGHPDYRLTIDMRQVNPDRQPENYLSRQAEMTPEQAMTRERTYSIRPETRAVGPVDFGWANKYLYFFVNHEYGGIGFGFAAAAIIWLFLRSRDGPDRKGWILVLIVALTGFIFINHIFELRPHPRYHLFVVWGFCAACASAGVLLARRWGMTVAGIFMAGIALVNILGLDLQRSRGEVEMADARALLRYATDPATPKPVHTTPATYGKARFILQAAGAYDTVIAAPPEPGRLYLASPATIADTGRRQAEFRPKPGWTVVARIPPRQTWIGAILETTGLLALVPAGIRGSLNRPAPVITLYKVPG